jgi:ribonuclease Z
MAGAFARKVAARQLILNHFSARYRGDESEESLRIMQGIADLAAGELGKDVVCARDFMTVSVSFNISS